MEKIKQGILAIAIAIIFVMFVAYAIQTFYPSPKWDDYCDIGLDRQNIETQQSCESVGGKWTEYGTVGAEGKPQPKEIDNETIPEGWCDSQFTCRQEYEDKSEFYNRNVFFIASGIGILTIILALIFAVESVSTGFLGGGVLLIIYGTIRYWGEMSDVYRTIMLAIALGVLIWTGYKRLK